MSEIVGLKIFERIKYLQEAYEEQHEKILEKDFLIQSLIEENQRLALQMEQLEKNKIRLVS